MQEETKCQKKRWICSQPHAATDGVKSVENEKHCRFPHVPNADFWKRIYGSLGSLRCACRRQHLHVKATQAMRRVKQKQNQSKHPTRRCASKKMHSAERNKRAIVLKWREKWGWVGARKRNKEMKMHFLTSVTPQVACMLFLLGAVCLK